MDINHILQYSKELMENFLAALLRLKEQLVMQTDKQVADALGMSATAFNQRKARAAFPETEVLALSARRPELKLDVTYVLTGERVSELQREQMAVLNQTVQATGDAALIEKTVDAHKEVAALQKRRKDAYKRHQSVLDLCTDEDMEMVMQLAVRLARARDK